MPIDYIPYMRKMIGSKRMLSVGLCALVVNEREEVLLEQRKDNGLYCLPGGSIDLDETVTEGVKREVREETGLELGSLSLLKVVSGPKNIFHYPNGDVTDYVDLIFYSRVSYTNEDLSGDHDQESTLVRFFPLDKLPPKEKFLRGAYEPIEKYLHHDLSVEVD